MKRKNMTDKLAETGQIKFTERLIAAGYNYAYGIAAGDIDGDGRLDIVASAERGSNEVRWWRNERTVLK